MNKSKRIIFDKEILDMVKSLSLIQLKDEASAINEMIEYTLDQLAEHLAYKDLIYREVWSRGQNEDKDNQD